MPIDREVFDKALRPKEVVLAYLVNKREDGKGYSCDEIARGLGLERDRVLRTLLALVQEEKIQTVNIKDKWYYRCV